MGKGFQMKCILSLIALAFLSSSCGSEDNKNKAEQEAENQSGPLKCNDSLRAEVFLASTLIQNQGIKNVIEIGGICEPLCTQLPGVNYILISPKKVSLPSSCQNSQNIVNNVLDVDFSKLSIKGSLALVALGIDIRGGEVIKDNQGVKKNTVFFKAAMDASDLVILESALNYAPKHDQLLELAELARSSVGPKEEKINVRITVNNFKMSAMEMFRHLITFEKK